MSMSHVCDATPHPPISLPPFQHYRREWGWLPCHTNAARESRIEKRERLQQQHGRLWNCPPVEPNLSSTSRSVIKLITRWICTFLAFPSPVLIVRRAINANAKLLCVKSRRKRGRNFHHHGWKSVMEICLRSDLCGLLLLSVAILNALLSM